MYRVIDLIRSDQIGSENRSSYVCTALLFLFAFLYLCHADWLLTYRRSVRYVMIYTDEIDIGILIAKKWRSNFYICTWVRLFPSVLWLSIRPPFSSAFFCASCWARRRLLASLPFNKTGFSGFGSGSCSICSFSSRFLASCFMAPFTIFSCSASPKSSWRKFLVKIYFGHQLAHTGHTSKTFGL